MNNTMYCFPFFVTPRHRLFYRWIDRLSEVSVLDTINVKLHTSQSIPRDKSTGTRLSLLAAVVFGSQTESQVLCYKLNPWKIPGNLYVIAKLIKIYRICYFQLKYVRRVLAEGKTTATIIEIVTRTLTKRYVFIKMMQEGLLATPITSLNSVLF